MEVELEIHCSHLKSHQFSLYESCISTGLSEGLCLQCIINHTQWEGSSIKHLYLTNNEYNAMLNE